MSDAIICGIISSVTTLLVAMGTWHFQMKKDRNAQKDELHAELKAYHEKNREEIEKIRQNDLKEIREDITQTREDITQMGANLQQKIAIVELNQSHMREDVAVLSNRVEKHNGVIERTYRLEDNDRLLDERIKVANHRIDDLERKS